MPDLMFKLLGRASRRRASRLVDGTGRAAGHQAFNVACTAWSSPQVTAIETFKCAACYFGIGKLCNS